MGKHVSAGILFGTVGVRPYTTTAAAAAPAALPKSKRQEYGDDMRVKMCRSDDQEGEACKLRLR